MVNICMLSVSDSSRPAKLKAAPTDLEVKVFVVLVGVRGIFGVLVGVCVVFLGCWLVFGILWLVGLCGIYRWLVCVVF